jgi:phosphinothricin acetyltransferase
LEARIRPGRSSDLEGILAVYNHYVRNSPATFEVEPVRREDRIGWLEEHSLGGRYRLYVAVDGQDSVIGWTTTSPFRPRAAYATTVESSVYLGPECSGQGIGTRLYGALFQAIGSEDIERIVAGMTLPNPASRALHLKFGFQQVGTFSRVGRKFGRYWDVAWYERPLRIPASDVGADPSDPILRGVGWGPGAHRPARGH